MTPFHQIIHSEEETGLLLTTKQRRARFQLVESSQHFVKGPGLVQETKLEGSLSPSVRTRSISSSRQPRLETDVVSIFFSEKMCPAPHSVDVPISGGEAAPSSLRAGSCTSNPLSASSPAVRDARTSLLPWPLRAPHPPLIVLARARVASEGVAPR
jgi:hypothetical protein